jgi:hypothetical protein
MELGSEDEEYLPANYTNLREGDKAVCRFGFADPASSLDLALGREFRCQGGICGEIVLRATCYVGCGE